MNDDRQDIIGIIQEVVRKQTTFYKHYIAQVVDNQDPITKGRVQVTIPELGILTNDSAIWAYPRDKQSLIVPAIESYVEVYFMGADPNRAVYMGISSEMADMTVKSYDGQPTTSILFEAQKNTGNYIKYDDIQKELDIIMNLIKVNSGTDFAVKYTALNTSLQTFMTALNAKFASKLDGSGSAGGLTLDISTAKVDKVMI